MNIGRKIRVILVGGFPKGRRVYGGQVSIGIRLSSSDFMCRHEVKIIDSTQISNPPPHIIFRTTIAFLRIFRFLCLLLVFRPDAVILFFARGGSAYEKGLMSRLAQFFGASSLVFPRAGGLIDDFFESSFFAWFIRKSLGRADVVLCQGVSFQRFAVTQLGFTEETAPVVPNWSAEPSHLEIGRERFISGSTAPVTRLLFLGWLEEPKGIFDLLEAASFLKASGVKFHLSIAGDGRAASRAKKFVEHHGLDEDVEFVGWISGSKKNEYLQVCDIFVLPSWSEGLPNAMIEAMSAGLACVVSRVGMVPDFVSSGRDALLIPPKDVQSLSTALKLVIEDVNLRTAIAHNGHLLAAAHFSLEPGTKRLSDALEMAVGLK